jgi:crotonobetainyl-CoA:carnitine CoA-transferase CaiB-like acyl-CoA transferase
MRKVAILTVAAAVSLAALTQFALGGDNRPKQSANASCTHFPYGCLTCADGPCVIKTRPSNPLAFSASSTAGGGSGANLPKPKVSETKR